MVLDDQRRLLFSVGSENVIVCRRAADDADRRNVFDREPAGGATHSSSPASQKHIQELGIYRPLNCFVH